MRSIREVVEATNTCLDDLAAIDLSQPCDSSVRDGLLDLFTAQHRLAAQVTRLAGEFDRRGLAPADGHRTTKAWLQAFARLPGNSAHALLRSLRTLRLLPDVAAAFADGRISAEHVDQIRRLHDREPDHIVSQVEHILLRLATVSDPVDVRKACDHVRFAAHANDGPDDEDGKAFERRQLTLSRVGSLWQLSGQLDSETGAKLRVALEAHTAPPGENDARTAAQRRHDALHTLVSESLENGRPPTTGGYRPQLGVLVPLHVLVDVPEQDATPTPPAGPAEAARPTGPAEPTKPTGPAGPVQPAGPAEAAGPVKAAGPAERAGAAGPAERARPAASTAPASPSGAASPRPDPGEPIPPPQLPPAPFRRLDHRTVTASILNPGAASILNPAAAATGVLEPCVRDNGGLDAGTLNPGARNPEILDLATLGCGVGSGTGPDGARRPASGSGALDPSCAPTDSQRRSNGKHHRSGGRSRHSWLDELHRLGGFPNLDAPRGGLGPQPAYLEGWGPISNQLAQRLACDSTLYRVILDPGTGLPLDVGRAYRCAPPWIRKALWIRDRHCRWPGCKTEASWCDAHHYLRWKGQDGPTALDNLILLCRYHHVLVHEGRWTLHFDPTTAEVLVTRPGGQEYELGPTHPHQGTTPAGTSTLSPPRPPPSPSPSRPGP